MSLSSPEKDSEGNVVTTGLMAGQVEAAHRQRARGEASSSPRLGPERTGDPSGIL